MVFDTLNLRTNIHLFEILIIFFTDRWDGQDIKSVIQFSYFVRV